jgi:hypothetical protein
MLSQAKLDTLLRHTAGKSLFFGIDCGNEYQVLRAYRYAEPVLIRTWHKAPLHLPVRFARILSGYNVEHVYLTTRGVLEQPFMVSAIIRSCYHSIIGAMATLEVIQNLTKPHRASTEVLPNMTAVSSHGRSPLRRATYTWLPQCPRECLRDQLAHEQEHVDSSSFRGQHSNMV